MSAKKKQSSIVSLQSATGGWLLFITFLLTAIGILFIFEASVAESYALFGHPYHFVSRQLRWLLIAIGALITGRVIPLTFWQKTAWVWYGLSLFALILVFVPGIGQELNGAHRWIFIGSNSFQPIELAKFGLIVTLSSWLTQHQRPGPFLFFTGLPALLVFLQPDVGSLLILLSISFGLFFVAGAKLRDISLMAGMGILLLAIAIVIAPYRLRRVTTFFNPESDPLGASFHIRQITFALGNGGLLGQGFGNSRQKYSYIPEASTDSIFAIIAEEIGLVGGIGLMMLFGVYLLMAFRLAHQPPVGSYAHLVGMGLFIWIAAQTVLNLAAVVALVPLTGVPLPFISYGGSALLMVFFITGMMLQVGTNREPKKES
jgi:cell division protein FtsW